MIASQFSSATSAAQSCGATRYGGEVMTVYEPIASIIMSMRDVEGVDSRGSGGNDGGWDGGGGGGGNDDGCVAWVGNGMPLL
jgi:hypothetical protein